MSYEVVGLLGRGGSAVVELAVDDGGRRVATKRIVLTGSAEQMRVARLRLRREAEILGGLAHAGIVPVLDVVDDGSEVVLVFPVLAENLEDRVARLGPLPPDEVIGIGRVLLEALAVAHRHGVVHRDIKPANVLFDETGRPALADFGVAVTWEVTAGLTQAGTVIGSPMWMAPEQARGEASGPAGDVFSLAATLTFAATGQGPYLPGPASVVMARAARNEVRAVPATVPERLRLPLQRMLAPRPQRRPSAAGVLGGLEGTMVAPSVRGHRSARRPRLRTALRVAAARLLGDQEGPRRHPRRRRWAIGMAAGGAVALTVLVLAALVVDRPGTAAAPPHPAASRPAVKACVPLPYQPCGAAVAAHTDGRACDPGWYDLDGLAVDGCEAHSDYVAGSVLTSARALRANLVPVAATDTFATTVHGDALRLCWGALHVTLTAPARTAEALTVWKGTTEQARALSADGSPATATLDKPSCFGADSEQLTVKVTVVAATGDASAGDFTLRRDGGW